MRHRDCNLKICTERIDGGRSHPRRIHHPPLRCRPRLMRRLRRRSVHFRKQFLPSSPPPPQTNYSEAKPGWSPYCLLLPICESLPNKIDITENEGQFGVTPVMAHA